MKRFLRLFSTADTTLGIIFFVKTRDNGGETWNILVYFGEKQQNICKEKQKKKPPQDHYLRRLSPNIFIF
jgi:hypothetical protein